MTDDLHRGIDFTSAEAAAEEVFHTATPEESLDEIWRWADRAAFLEDPHIWFRKISTDRDSYTAPPKSAEVANHTLISNKQGPSQPNIIHRSSDNIAHSSPSTVKPIVGSCATTGILGTGTLATPLTNSQPSLASSSTTGLSLNSLIPAVTKNQVPVANQTTSHNSHSGSKSLPPLVTQESLNQAGPTSSSAQANTNNYYIAGSSMTGVKGGHTFPLVFEGKETWFCQHPGCCGRYSRYGDLVKFSKERHGQTYPGPLPQASKIARNVAMNEDRRMQTAGQGGFVQDATGAIIRAAGKRYSCVRKET